MQAERADGDLLDTRMQPPGAGLELQPAEIEVELASPGMLPLQVREELPCFMPRSDEPERAGDDNREEEEV
jgi:hypothetical protein